jgi:hypothetical protein
VSAPYFLATKIEAFKGRDKGDFLASHDLEDLIFVIDGRRTITEEVKAEVPFLREYLRTEIRGLLMTPNSWTPYLATCYPMPSQTRTGTVVQRLETLGS